MAEYIERTEELKPCPFCGERHIRTKHHFDRWFCEEWWEVRCIFCGAMIESKKFETEAIAVLAWNRREFVGKPTVDAIPVIRCRDCKHRGTNGCPMHINGRPADDDYCSHGERIRAIRYKADFVYTMDEDALGALTDPDTQWRIPAEDLAYWRTLAPRETVVEDTKSPGTRTAVYKLKRKLMQERYGISIREV